MQLRHLAIVIILLLSSVAHAASNISCVPAVVKVEDKSIILPGSDDPKIRIVYFFNNISKKSLWLDHPVEKPSASAGWSSYLRMGNWSALSINRKNFKISCAEIQPGKVDYQECATSVAICTPKQMPKSDAKHKVGSGWIVEDKSWDEFVLVLSKKGF